MTYKVMKYFGPDGDGTEVAVDVGAREEEVERTDVVVVTARLVVEAGTLVALVEETAGAVPGTHWSTASQLWVSNIHLLYQSGVYSQYQAFWEEQYAPEAQLVEPVHPVPPHCPQTGACALAVRAKPAAMRTDAVMRAIVVVDCDSRGNRPT